MILEFIKQPLVMMFICALLVFAEMFLAKKWYISFTKNIKNVKARRGTNFILGIVTCLVLALSQMAALCDIFAISYLWQFAIASAFIATFIYISLEKIYGESEVNEVGKTFCEVISHSDKFDGNITHDGMVSVAREMLAVVTKIDEQVKSREKKAINDVVSKLDEFLADGKITADEKAQAQKLVEGINIESYPFFEKYKALLDN